MGRQGRQEKEGPEIKEATAKKQNQQCHFKKHPGIINIAIENLMKVRVLNKDELEGWVHGGKLLVSSLNWQMKITSIVTNFFIN